MFRKIQDFESVWSQEVDATKKIFKHIPDRFLSQSVYPEGRTLGRIAWHIVLTIPEMMNRTGITVAGPHEDAPVPSSMKEILGVYEEAARSLLEQVKSKWNDNSLEETDEMYGQVWKRGVTLTVLVAHQTHHRGQITVLMRQAGLKVPGVYGPAKEEWAQWGMPEPTL
ncbi:MAG: DinB family protein [Terriglobia bacterium]